MDQLDLFMGQFMEEDQFMGQLMGQPMGQLMDQLMVDQSLNMVDHNMAAIMRIMKILHMGDSLCILESIDMDQMILITKTGTEIDMIITRGEKDMIEGLSF